MAAARRSWGPSGSLPWLLGGSEDPWLSVPVFWRVWLCWCYQKLKYNTGSVNRAGSPMSALGRFLPLAIVSAHRQLLRVKRSFVRVFRRPKTERQLSLRSGHSNRYENDIISGSFRPKADARTTEYRTTLHPHPDLVLLSRVHLYECQFLLCISGQTDNPCGPLDSPSFPTKASIA